METLMWQIVNGPGLFELSIALFRGGDGDSIDFQIRVTSYAYYQHTLCQIHSMADCGNKKEWDIEGKVILPKSLDPERSSRQFTASYNLANRRGMMTVVML